LLSGGGVIDVEHLPTEKMRANRVVEAPPTPVAPPTPPAPVVPEPEAPPAPTSGLPSPGRGGAITRDDIIDALARAGGNQTEAAKLLGVSRRTFINRVIEFDVPRPRKK
jgi:two-component system response regulator AtoC